MSKLAGARLLSIATLVSRVMGFGKNTVLAAALGTGIVGDAYNVANTIPNIVFTVISGGVLSAVFVPQIVRAFERGNEDGRTYSARLVGLTIAFAAPLTAALTFCAPLVVAAAAPRDWSAAQFSLTVALAYMCLPQVFFYSLYAVLGQILNAQRKFGAMAWAPAINNLVAILVGVSVMVWGAVEAGDAGSVSPQIAVILGVGTTTGVALQATVVAVAASRAGIGIRFRSRPGAFPLRRAFSLAKWSVAQLAVTQLATFLVLRAAASTAAPLQASSGIAAGFTSFNYAYLVVLLPHAVIAMSIATSAMPVISGHLVGERRSDYAASLRRGLDSIRDLIVPVSAFLTLGGVPVAIVLFGYGQTSTADAWYIGLVLTAFAVGLLPMSTRSLYLYAMYAAEDTRVPFFIASSAAAVYAGLAFTAAWFLPSFWKLIGVAAALGLSNVLAVLLMRRALRKAGRAPSAPRSGELPKIVVATAIGLAVAQGATLLLGFGWMFDRPDDHAIVVSLIRLAALGVGVAVSVVVAHLLGVSSVRSLLRAGK